MSWQQFIDRYGIALLILSTAIIQTISHLNPDSAWLLTAADRMVAGEYLYIDISETNPPLVVWLHAIAVYLSHALSFPLDHAFIICILITIYLSLSACKRINISYPPVTLFFALMVTLFAAQNFGQREHLFLLLAMPSFLSLLPSNKPSVTAGLFAAIGFALKPYFVLFFIAGLIYHAWRSKNIRNVFHKAHLAAAVPVIIYAAYLLFIDTTYLTTTALPLLDYYHGYTVSLSELLTDMLPIALLMFGSYGFWLASKQYNPALHFIVALSVAALGTILLQHKGWMNHWYLFYVFAFCLNANIIWVLRKDLSNIFAKLAMTLAIMAALTIAGIYSTITANMLRHQQFEQVEPMVELLSPHSGSTAMSFSFDLMASFPSTLHADLYYEGTYAHLWFLPGLYQEQIDAETKRAIYRNPSDMGKQERAWFDAVSGEFNRLLPDIVIVTSRDNYHHPEHGTYDFNFIDYYSQSPYFAQSWKHYELMDTIGNEQVYKRR